MYREHNFWQWLGAFLLGLIAVVSDLAYLSDIGTNLMNWAIQSGFLHELGIALGRLLHLIEFSFRHFGVFFFALLIWWLLCKR